jgi:Spy/CpxP family protein refolding chaperone
MNAPAMMHKDGNQMKRDTRSRVNLMVLSAAVIIFCLSARVTAQTTQTQNSSPPVQAPAENFQIKQMGDVGQLDLRQDQVDKIRDIWVELNPERQAAVRQQRRAQIALNQAIESPTPNETSIAERSRELAEAQANTIRLRSVTEARILQVLTPEQRTRLREIRQRNMALRRERQQGVGNGLNQRQQGLQQRDPNNSLLTPAQRRALRQQQRKP